MKKTTFKKLETYADRFDLGNANSSGYFSPPTDIVDYAQKAALGADEIDFSRILEVFRRLEANGAIPEEITEIASIVREHRGGKEH